MAKIEYVPRKFAHKTMVTIDRVNAMLDEYEAQGFDLTVRQIYYQFVSQGWLEENSLKQYKNLASVINDARLAGLIDWDRIVDRTRYLRKVTTWDNPESIIDACARQYKQDVWADQKNRIEVWIEKDALVGVIERVCEENRVPFLSCRGYTSQSEMHDAAKRLNSYYAPDAATVQKAQNVHIIHLGDHDPSGLDMTRDITDRLDLFTSPEAVHVHRIALNMPQVRQYNPPPNPAKLTDSRCDKYMAEHGDESWELDALKPQVIVALIQKTIDGLKDTAAWKRSMAAEKIQRDTLVNISSNYEDVKRFMRHREECVGFMDDRELV